MSERDGSPSPGWGTDWNRTIHAVPIAMYCDWRKAGRPGFAPMDNLRLQAWCRRWKTVHSSARVPHQGRVA